MTSVASTSRPGKRNAERKTQATIDSFFHLGQKHAAIGGREPVREFSRAENLNDDSVPAPIVVEERM